MAANAADGTVIPQVVTGDNWVGDIDDDNTNGEVRWVKQNVTFTVNKKLVPGKYTFTAKLTNPGAAVIFTINGVQTTIDKSAAVTIVEIPFTITEAVEALQINAKAITDFEEGQNNDYLLSFAKDKDGNLTQGIVFDRQNFQDPKTGKWIDPLKGINEAIDTWVNKTLKYESEKARLVMTSEKEKIQKETTNDKLTYDFYMKNHLDDPTVETNPLYKEAAQKYNEATRIEAEYQAKAITDAVNAFLDENSKIDPETKKPISGTADDAAKAMAKKVEDKVADYEAKADAKTKSGENYLDAPVALDTEFDVDPTSSPLKEIWEDVNALTDKTSTPAKVTAALQKSLKAIVDADAALEDMFGADDEADVNQVATMALTAALKDKSQHYLDSAMQITAYYNKLAHAVLESLKDKAIKDMDDELLADINKKLNVVNSQVQVTFASGKYSFSASPLKEYAAVYNNYVTKKAEALSNVVETPKLSDKAQEWLNEKKNAAKKTAYENKLKEFTTAVDNVTKSITVPDLVTTTHDKEKYVALKDIENELYKGTEYREPNGTTVSNTSTADDALLKAFVAYNSAIEALANAYTLTDEAYEKIDKAYEDYKNEDFDNRKYFKEAFNDYFYKLDADNMVDDTKTTTPDAGKTVTYYDFLDGIYKHVEDQWTKDDKGKFNGKMVAYVSADDNTKYFNKTITEFVALFTPATPANSLQNRSIPYARISKETNLWLKAYEEAIEKLRAKVAGMPIYTADQALYDDAKLVQKDGTTPYLYKPSTAKFTTPKAKLDKRTNAGKTYKQILADYDAQLKAFKDALKDAESKWDNTTTVDFWNAYLKVYNDVWRVVGGIDLPTDPALLTDAEWKKFEDAYWDIEGTVTDSILFDIDYFVADGGIIDQQAKVYAENMPEDNFKQLMAHIGAATGDGELGKLWTRLRMDNQGKDKDDNVKQPGWRDPLGDTEWKDGDYIVGIDQNGDGKVAFDEGVSIQGSINTLYDLKTGLDAYGKKLSEENYNYILQLMKAYVEKFREAEAIYDKFATTKPTSKEAFEAANGELGVAIAIINELNQKLTEELEPELIAEAEALFKWKKIVEIVKADPSVDGEKVNYQTGYIPESNFASTTDPLIKQWWNGRKGVSKKTMDGNVYRALSAMVKEELEAIAANDTKALKDIEKRKQEANPNDQELYNQLLTIWQNANKIFAAADEAYRTRDFSAWNLKFTEKEDGSGKTYEPSIDNAELNQNEKLIKTFVINCWNEQDNIIESVESLVDLMTLSNIDDEDDDKYDWSNLIKTADPETTGSSAFTAVVLELKKQLEDAVDAKPGLTDEEKLAKKNAIGDAVNAILGLKTFAIEDLLVTTGIEAIQKNDKAAKSADELLEPVAEDENHTLQNQHTFENMLRAADDQLEPTDAPKAAEARMLAGAEEESIIAQLMAQLTNKSSAELYNKLQAFIEKVNAAIADRTLASKYSELKKELETLTEDIINIDEHAAANKARFDEMNQKIADFEHGSSEMSTDNLQKIYDAMLEGTAKKNAQTALNKFKQDYLDGLKAIVAHDYVQGWGWQDAFNSDTDTQGDQDKAFAEMQKEAAKVYDILTGNNNTQLVDDNNEAYDDFLDLYHDAQKEFADLVAKLEHFKNLNANVPATKADDDDFNREDAEALAKEINKFLFGKEKAADDDVIATLSAKDQLDNAYKNGTKAKEDANEVPTAWGDADYTKQITDVKQKIEAYITKVDNKVKDATKAWGKYSENVLGKAEEALNLYKTYDLEKKELASKKPKAKEKYDSEDAYNAADAAYKAKKTEILEAIIAENPYWSDLYSRSTLIDAAIERYFDDNNLKTVGANTYRRNNFDNINALYDLVAYFKDNFGDELQNGLDAEAQAEVAIYKAHGDDELAKDKAALEKLGFELDQVFDGVPTDVVDGESVPVTFKYLIDKYNGLFIDKDGKPIKITSDNRVSIVGKIGDFFGTFKTSTKNGEEVTYEWNEDGLCKFVHQLVTNDSETNKALNESILNDLQSKLDAAKAYIKDFQVGANYVEQIQVYQDFIDQAKENIKDEDYIKSAIVITDHVQGLVKKFGDFTSRYGKTSDASWAGKDGIVSSADDDFGSMMAEVGYLPVELIDAAWDAEKKALEKDVNEMRAELKKLSEQSDIDAATEAAYNDKIESLWKKVEPMKCETKLQEFKNNKGVVIGHQFIEQLRPNLLPLQNEIQKLYIELRGLTHASQNIAGIVGNANGRLAALRSNMVQDEYAAGAPDVQKLQGELNALIEDAQATLSATVAAGSTDFFREKIEQMLQNAENKLTSRDAAAKVWTDRKAQFDENIALVAKKVENSKEGVNEWTRSQWIDGSFVVSEEFPIEGYDLAATQSALYDIAAEKLQAFVEARNAVVDNYQLNAKKTGYDLSTKEIKDLEVDYQAAIKEAENACADYDLNARLADLNEQFDVLKNKAANGVYAEDYLESKDIILSKDDDGIVWGTAITDLEDQLTSILADIEKAQYVGQSTGKTYKKIRAQIEKFITKKDAETGEYILVLNNGAQLDLNKLSELLMNNVLGDMNNDGRVTLADARIIADIALKYLPMPNVGSDEFLHADVNQDGKIDIADAACAVNIYFYGKAIGYWNPLLEARSAAKSNEKVEVSTSKTAEGLTRVAISLDNAQEYTAFQMDMLLPEGIKLAAASLGDRANSQFLMTNMVDDNVLRIAAMSITNKAISGNSGAVVYLDFEVAEGAQDEFARFSEVFFVNKQAQKTSFELGGITPTGIQSANAETALGQKIYDLGGRMKSSLKKGVNIIKDAAGNAKKVFTK